MKNEKCKVQNAKCKVESDELRAAAQQFIELLGFIAPNALLLTIGKWDVSSDEWKVASVKCKVQNAKCKI
jgi:hypothetical protein